MLLMVLPAGVAGAGVGVGDGVGVGAAMGVTAAGLGFGVEPPPPHPVIEIAARASTPTLQVKDEMKCIYLLLDAGREGPKPLKVWTDESSRSQKIG